MLQKCLHVINMAKRPYYYLADRAETEEHCNKREPASAGVNIYICFICLFRTIKYRPLSTHSNTHVLTLPAKIPRRETYSDIFH